MLENLKIHDCYNVVGHLDYISRYAPYDDKSVYDNEYMEIIDEILKVLVKKDKGLDDVHLHIVMAKTDVILSLKYLKGLMNSEENNHCRF